MKPGIIIFSPPYANSFDYFESYIIASYSSLKRKSLSFNSILYKEKLYLYLEDTASIAEVYIN